MDPTFASLGLPERMVTNLARRGITEPFPIQAATLPDALAGRDVCGRAPTGSGKTLAFGIPLVLTTERARPRRPRALVLVPTRELAAQVTHELQLLSKPKGPWVEAFYGGIGFQKQLAGLKRGVDIAVACPGRLADLIAQEQCSLRDVTQVVIDEADRMADMGFLPEVKRLLDQCAPERQTLLFSATLDGDVDVLIRRYQHDPARHEHVVDEDPDLVTHAFWSVPRTERLATAAKIVADHGSTVVFCRTKRGADRVARQLESAGVSAAAIHGDRSQAQRERALRSFHEGRVAALVATDVAARGIHVDGVACVVHFDLPDDPKDYVHRSGRTARAGATGVVITLVTDERRADATRLQRALGYPVELTAPFSPPDGANRPNRERPERRRKAPAKAGTRGKQRTPRSGRDSRDATESLETVATIAGDTGGPKPRRARHRHDGPRVRTKPRSRSGARPAAKPKGTRPAGHNPDAKKGRRPKSSGVRSAGSR
jgi:superfamily II DNA/RNA helicase